MPYIAPAPADLKGMLPDFAAVPDATVQSWLTRAGRDVDQSWTEGDYAYAIVLLAAHFMTQNGIGAGASGLPDGVTDFRSGSFSVAIDREVVKVSAAGGYGATRYGRQFAQLLAKNRGGSRTTAGGALPIADGFNGFAGPIPVWQQP